MTQMTDTVSSPGDEQEQMTWEGTQKGREPLSGDTCDWRKGSDGQRGGGWGQVSVAAQAVRAAGLRPAEGKLLEVVCAYI